MIVDRGIIAQRDTAPPEQGSYTIHANVWYINEEPPKMAATYSLQKVVMTGVKEKVIMYMNLTDIVRNSLLLHTQQSSKKPPP